jgi:FkbM family methyltransferase
LHDLLRTVALFIRDSGLLLRSPQSKASRIGIWKDFLKMSLASVERGGEITLSGFHVSYFDRPTLLYLYREIFVRQTYWFQGRDAQPVILDCGANLGMATLFFKYLFPDATIQCFEPDRKTFEVLQRNVERNVLAKVNLYNVALWDEATEIPFYANSNAPGNLLMSTNGNRTTGTPALVSARRLSTYIDQDVDLLKLDVEGAELRVLRELASSGKISRIRQMIVEYHHKIPDEPSSMSHLLRILEDNGFEYQITASGFPLAQPERFQDVMIYAYQRQFPNEYPTYR